MMHNRLKSSLNLVSPMIKSVPASARNFSSPPLPTNLPPHLLSTADLSVEQIDTILTRAAKFKSDYLSSSTSVPGRTYNIPQLLKNKSVAILFSKRSTRTRLASETSVNILGGQSLFLGSQDIQLGVNETLLDSSKVISSMTDGIFARVGGHDEIETLAKYSSVPVINALSERYHPTQTLADLQTMIEMYCPDKGVSGLKGLTVTWVGDQNNIIWDMLVTYPRLGIKMRVASPDGYPLDSEVKNTISAQGMDHMIHFTNDPKDAVMGADIVVTDTWISMGQETEAIQRKKDFAGFQVSESLCETGSAKPDWKFMHCLPRKPEEVDDEVFYGGRSVVWQEAENRKWSILSLFYSYFGKWTI